MALLLIPLIQLVVQLIMLFYRIRPMFVSLVLGRFVVMHRFWIRAVLVMDESSVGIGNWILAFVEG